MNIRTDEEELRDQQDLTEEEMKNLNDLEGTNQSLSAQNAGIKKAHEQLQKELKTLLKDKEKMSSKYTKQIKEIKSKVEEEKQTLGK